MIWEAPFQKILGAALCCEAVAHKYSAGIARIPLDAKTDLALSHMISIRNHALALA